MEGRARTSLSLSYGRRRPGAVSLCLTGDRCGDDGRWHSGELNTKGYHHYHDYYLCLLLEAFLSGVLPSWNCTIGLEQASEFSAPISVLPSNRLSGPAATKLCTCMIDEEQTDSEILEKSQPAGEFLLQSTNVTKKLGDDDSRNDKALFQQLKE